MDLCQTYHFSFSNENISKIFKNCFDKATENIKVLEYIGLERQF